MFSKLFTTKEYRTTEFSRFIREASSRERKKVYMDVLKKATEDQKKILNADFKKKAA